MIKNYSFLILLFIFLSCDYSNAQWSIGIQGGVNISKYELSNKDPEVDISNKYGIIIGGVISYDINSNYYILSGIRYIQKGGKVKINFPFFLVDNKAYFNYIEVPAYFNFSPFEFNIKPIIYGGVEMGYLLEAKSEGTVNGEKSKVDYTDGFKKIDIALAIGLGLRYEIGSNFSYLFNANYSYGVKNISEQITTRGIHISLGVIYSL
jgi:hypothetical protein